MSDYPNSCSKEGVEFTKRVAIDVAINEVNEKNKANFEKFVRNLKEKLYGLLIITEDYQIAVECIEQTIRGL